MKNAIEEIESKIDKVMELKKAIWSLEKDLEKDLIQLDMDAFNGLKWHEFMSSINEVVQVNESLSIKRESYHVDATYEIDENVTMSVYGNMYYGDDRFSTMIRYKNSDRVVQVIDVPKKYTKQFEEIKTEIRKYQFERPSEKYGKKLRLAYY